MIPRDWTPENLPRTTQVGKKAAGWLLHSRSLAFVQGLGVGVSAMGAAPVVVFGVYHLARGEWFMAALDALIVCFALLVALGTYRDYRAQRSEYIQRGIVTLVCDVDDVVKVFSAATLLESYARLRTLMRANCVKPTAGRCPACDTAVEPDKGRCRNGACWIGRIHLDLARHDDLLARVGVEAVAVTNPTAKRPTAQELVDILGALLTLDYFRTAARCPRCGGPAISKTCTNDECEIGRAEIALDRWVQSR